MEELTNLYQSSIVPTDNGDKGLTINQVVAALFERASQTLRSAVDNPNYTPRRAANVPSDIQLIIFNLHHKIYPNHYEYKHYGRPNAKKEMYIDGTLWVMRAKRWRVAKGWAVRGFKVA